MKFIILGQAISQNNGYISFRIKMKGGKRGPYIRVHSKMGKAWITTLREQLSEQLKDKDTPLYPDDNIGLKLWFYHSNKRKRDIDNHLKLLFDAIQDQYKKTNGLLVHDDAQIKEVYVHKEIDVDNPRVEFIVYKYGEEVIDNEEFIKPKDSMTEELKELVGVET